MYNILTGKAELSIFEASEFDQRFDHIRKYTSDEYQWFVDIKDEAFDSGAELSHLSVVLILERIRRARPVVLTRELISHITDGIAPT